MRHSKGGGGLPGYGLALAGIVVLLFHAPSAVAQSTSHLDVSLGADYRQAHLDWNIAGQLDGTSPNVLSELIWRDLEIAQISAGVLAHIGEHIKVRGNFAYGDIQGGQNQDSDYLGDNRTFEFSRSRNGTDGEIADGSLALGYTFKVFDPSVKRYAEITPMVGYSKHVQNLKMNDGYQVIPALGSFSGLDSSYDAEWEGPWAGLNLRLEASRRAALLIDLEYHWADYTGEGNWNLRDDFAHPVSFRHVADGNGFIAALAVDYKLKQNWKIIARIESQRWEADAGTDTTYVIGEPAPIKTRLSSALWKSRSLGVALTYQF